MKQINTILGNIFLPLVWVALTGRFTVANLAIGFGVSTFCMWIVSSPSDVTFLRYLQRLWRFCGFILFFIWEVILANLRVAREVLTPGYGMRPAIVAIDLDLHSELEITILANLITLTPGTLSLDVSPDRRTLYVHAMYVEDLDRFRSEIKTQLERRVAEVFQ